MKADNQSNYQKLFEIKKQKYLRQYKTGEKKASDKIYFRTTFQREVLDKNKNKLYTSQAVSDAIKYRNEKKWLENIDEFDAIKKFCKLQKQNLHTILERVAEYEAIISVWHEVNSFSREISNSEAGNNQPLINQTFKLRESVISKIDFIRIINVLWELKGFEKNDGSNPTKQDTMKAFGSIIGINLINYDKDLSKALNNSSLETNLAIFKKMESKATSIFTDKT